MAQISAQCIQSAISACEFAESQELNENEKKRRSFEQVKSKA
jgi:hypothetical protein